MPTAGSTWPNSSASWSDTRTGHSGSAPSRPPPTSRVSCPTHERCRCCSIDMARSRCGTSRPPRHMWPSRWRPTERPLTVMPARPSWTRRTRCSSRSTSSSADPALRASSWLAVTCSRTASRPWSAAAPSRMSTQTATDTSPIRSTARKQAPRTSSAPSVPASCSSSRSRSVRLPSRAGSRPSSTVPSSAGGRCRASVSWVTGMPDDCPSSASPSGTAAGTCITTWSLRCSMTCSASSPVAAVPAPVRTATGCWASTWRHPTGSSRRSCSAVKASSPAGCASTSTTSSARRCSSTSSMRSSWSPLMAGVCCRSIGSNRRPGCGGTSVVPPCHRSRSRTSGMREPRCATTPAARHSPSRHSQAISRVPARCSRHRPSQSSGPRRPRIWASTSSSMTCAGS